MVKKPKARVSRIGIGRLYNLGNYEHIRYDITIDVPEGADALKAVERLREILRALRPAKHSSALDSAKRLLAMPAAERRTAIESGRYLDRHFIEAKELVKKSDEAAAKREKAKKLFNDLAGATVYTDHKEKWEDDYYEDY